MGKFGRFYPPGCSGPPDDRDMACDVCGIEAGACECPECPVCGVAGDPKCYEEHGLKRPETTNVERVTAAQSDSTPPGEKLRNALRAQSFATAIRPLVQAIHEEIQEDLDDRGDDWKGEIINARSVEETRALRLENLESAESLIEKLVKIEEKAGRMVERLDPEGNWGN